MPTPREPKNANPRRDGQETRPRRNAANRTARSRQVRATITRWRMYGVTAFAAIMLLGGVIGLLFFARPTTSAVEMRNLTTFPEFSVQSFLNGSYFTEVSLWYADTYPLREPMVAADHAIDGLFGINTGTGLVGGNVQADEIPVETETDEGTPEVTVVEPPSEVPDARMVAEEVQNNIMSGIYVQNGMAYNIYYFSQYATDTYISAMNTAAERLDGVSTVYSMLVPTNTVTLDKAIADAVGGSDQQQTQDYVRTRLDSRVKHVNIIDTLSEHGSEYLFFHTDHHWTQLGAYYAYVELCKAKGIEPVAYDDHRMVNLGELQGTFYDTVAAMGAVDADTFDAAVPNGTNSLTYWGTDGGEYEGQVINEAAADWDPSGKYLAFIMGDQPLEIIENPQVTDGSSCLIVKDSYGCAFTPNMVDSYQTIYVMDFRSAPYNICDYAIEHEIQDVVFLTNMKIGLSDSVAETLLAEVS